MDIAPTAIAWAQEKAQGRGLRADFRVGNMLDLAGIPDATFDVVLDGHCLHCIIGADQARFFAAARRVLKPGGIFHVATMCGDPISEIAKTNYDPVSRCTVYGDIATRYFGRVEDILTEVLSGGFEVTDWEEHLSTNAGDQHMLFVSTHHPAV